MPFTAFFELQSSNNQILELFFRDDEIHFFSFARKSMIHYLPLIEL